MSRYHCENCEAIFDHPNTEECESVEGHCILLVTAGWKPAWVKVSLEAPVGEQNQHIFSRGGWICPACVKQYAVPAKTRRRIRRAA